MKKFIIMFIFLAIFMASFVSATIINQTAEEPLDRQINIATANNLVGWRIEPINTLVVLNVYRNNTDAGSDNPNVVRIRDETNTVIGEANFSGLKADFGNGVLLLAGGNYSIVMTNTTDTWDTPRSTGTSTLPFTFNDIIVNGMIQNDGLEYTGVQDWWVIERVEYASSGIVTTLHSPTNDSNILKASIDFNSSALSFNISLSNATLYIWDSIGTLLGTQSQTISGIDITNETIFTNDTLDFGSFSWNVLACGNNDTGSAICSFASSNFSFAVTGFTVDTESFQSQALETESQTFGINITTITDVLSVDAELIYNGTSHPVTQANVGNNFTLSSTIDVPLVLSGSESNFSFFWQITTFDGTTSDQINTTTRFQNTTRIHFQQCDATITTLAINFTAFDEVTGNRIDPFFLSGEFVFWLGGGDVKRPLSFSNQTTSEFGLCISPSSQNFSITDTIEYNDFINSTTYSLRNFFFQDDLISSVARHVKLFLLNDDDATSFILKVQDTNLIPVSGAIIKVQRFDVATANFTTVQVARTDDQGQSVAFLQVEVTDYRFIIEKDGQTLLTTTRGKIIGGETPFTIIFTVGEDVGASWTRYEDLPDLTSSLVFNATSSVISFTYVDVSGNFSSSRLLVSRKNASGSDSTVCDVSGTQTSEILTCDLEDRSGSYIASGFITRGTDTFLVEQEIFSINEFAQVAGRYGLFLSWFVILISVFVFRNILASLAMINITTISLEIIGLTHLGALYIFSMIGVSILIMVLFKK